MANIFEFFFLNGRRTVIISENVAFTIDAVVSGRHNFDSTITQHPVEKGANINDHVIHQPDRLVFDCVISDDPMQIGNIEAIGAGAAIFNNSEKPSKQAYDFFKSLKENSDLLTIDTSLNQYTNMILKSITIPRSVRQSNALFCTLDFQKINIVESKEVEIEVDSNNSSTNDKNKPNQNQGKKQQKPLNETRKASWFLRFTDYTIGG